MFRRVISAKKLWTFIAYFIGRPLLARYRQECLPGQASSRPRRAAESYAGGKHPYDFFVTLSDKQTSMSYAPCKAKGNYMRIDGALQRLNVKDKTKGLYGDKTEETKTQSEAEAKHHPTRGHQAKA